jgi:hypothetical protein
MSLESADGLSRLGYQARAELGGEFEFGGVAPGKYLLNPHLAFIVTALSGGSGSARGEQIIVDGSSDRRVTATVGTGADLNGVVDLRGANSTEVSVLAFPEDDGLWSGYGNRPTRLIEGRLGSGGSYYIGGIPPGDYCVVAVPHGVEDWRMPEVLRKLRELGRRISLANADSVDLDLPVVSWPSR